MVVEAHRQAQEMLEELDGFGQAEADLQPGQADLLEPDGRQPDQRGQAAGLLLLGLLGAAWVQPQGWGSWLRATPADEQALLRGEAVVMAPPVSLPVDRTATVAVESPQADAEAAGDVGASTLAGAPATLCEVPGC